MSESRCPGCGLSLPARAGPPAPRLTASRECWRLYGEVTGPAMTDPELADCHQITVDAYAAHHAGADGPPITTAFALVGLHLALELSWPGPRVRQAHQRLAQRGGDWPAFSNPGGLDSLGHTVRDLARAGSPPEHREALHRWGGAVWEAWAAEHSRVAGLLARYGVAG